MSEHTYKVVQIVGSSPDGVQQAIDNAIAKAGESVRKMRWFEVDELRGQIADGSASHYQVKLNIGFTLE